MAASSDGFKKTIATVAGLAILFVIALALDVPASAWAHKSGVAEWLQNRDILSHLLRVPGHFIFFTIPICLLVLAIGWGNGFRGWPACKDAAIVLLAGILSAINDPLKWLIGRTRPYHGVPPFELHPFKVGLLNVEASFSFPSGDVTLAAAMAASLTMVLPKLWPLWWTLTVTVALERIAANAHYPSDTVAGAALGIFVAVIARKIVEHFAGTNATIARRQEAISHRPADTPSMP